MAASSEDGSTVHWIICNGNPAASEDDLRWLSDVEHQRLVGYRFPKRRSEWLLGRWTAKSLLVRSVPAFARLDFRDFTISNEPDGAPYALLAGSRIDGSLSISHRNQRAFCAFCSASGVGVGADLETIESRSDDFINDYFTAREIQLLEGNPGSKKELLATLIWSAKEAVLKALGKGLRVDTRQVSIEGIETPDADSSPVPEWCALTATAPQLTTRRVDVVWRLYKGDVLTLAVLS